MISNVISALAPLVSSDYYNYTYRTATEGELALFSGTSLIFFCCYLVIIVAVYAFTAYCLMKMAENLGLGDQKIFAWIPFLNYYLLVLMAKRDVIWFILMFLPFVNIVALIVVWLDVLKRFNKDVVWLLLLFVPLVNFWVMWTLANEKPAA